MGTRTAAADSGPTPRPATGSAGFELAAPERSVLGELARRRDRFGRRAATLLCLADGSTQTAAAAAAGMSERQARFWLAEFRERRLEIFPADLVRLAAEAPEPAAAQPDLAALEPPPAADAPTADPEVAARRVDPALPMAEAVGRLLAVQVERMLANEAGTREGEDPEALHDMRVAVRRMRALLRVAAEGLDDRAVERLDRGLRRLGGRLGDVRDLDVFGAQLAAHAASVPDDLAGLQGAWHRRRETARERLVAALDGDRYARLRERLDAFVANPGAGSPAPVRSDGSVRPLRVAHLLPPIVLTRWAAVQAYDGWVGAQMIGAPLERLHRLRIAAKYLRYTLEFFAEMLGREGRDRVREVRRLQDVLGALQDAVVATGMLRDFLVWGDLEPHPRRDQPPAVPVVAPGVVSYLGERQRDIERLTLEVPAVWDPVRAPAFRRGLELALARIGT